jgi:hypothetical protein
MEAGKREFNSPLGSTTKSDAKLEMMNLLRQPGHQEQEKAEHHRSHSEARQRYDQMLAVEFLKLIFLHVISYPARNMSPSATRPKTAGYLPVP